jgi:DNA (cytosine-5)-methyltransferase 1
MARLHGFPDWFRFQQTKWHGARQIGNAVAPPMARAIGKSIMKAAGFVPQNCSDTIRLGDPVLVKMDVGAASKYWGIEPPIGKRDRKSGARKRSQQETEAARLLAQSQISAQNRLEF